jgi:hypothetical protein
VVEFVEFGWAIMTNHGRDLLYFALMWSVYVSIKALYEAYMTAKNDLVGECDEKQKYAHKRSHIAALLGIAFYSIYNIFAYIWFDLKDTGLGNDDRSIGVFNLLFMNLLWLIIISHFKHERKGDVNYTSWKELLKF